ncbi:Embryonic polyadenylate-binding protein 2-B [Taenia solium]|eukprot:TsM_000958900 transcript=TsM_000958900 gene=TsM_000958900
MSDFVLDAVQEGENDEFVDESLKEELEIERIKDRLKEVEEDANKLHNLTNADKSSKNNLSTLSGEDKGDVDLRSIYVGNVDYGSTADELEAHFRCCGAINRVTILCDRYTGHPKGFAYIEFENADAIEAAVALDDSCFRGRALKVMPKRTNIPGFSTTMRGFRRPRRRYSSYGVRYAFGMARPRTSRFRRRRIYCGAPY